MVGKTSILTRLQHDTFSPDEQPTIGGSFFTKAFSIQGVQVNLSLWDTAGQERYRSLVPMYSRHCAAALIVFDASTKLDFTSLEHWIHPVRQEAPDAVIVIVGNKCDLPLAVDPRDVKNWAKRSGFLCLFVSALTGSGISELFEAIATSLAIATPSPPGTEKMDITVDSGSRRCCS
jgi:Ras-related protein Rab-5C